MEDRNMPRAKILFADNDTDFLETRSEFLEKDGYEVIQASSPRGVLDILEHHDVNLAVLDIRMLNDDDEKDISGLEVAKTIGRFIPIIMLTGYSGVEYARQALEPQVDGRQIAQGFVSKVEGPEALLTAIEKLREGQKVLLVNTKESPTFKKWRPRLALIALLLTLGSGIIAMIYADPSWLIGTVFFAIMAVLFMGIE
jgi:CheY-like chemotaxis protein